MAVQEPASFDVEGLTRVDTLYFTVTPFSSVGFGDISAASQTARILVTIQMMLGFSSARLAEPGSKRAAFLIADGVRKLPTAKGMGPAFLAAPR